MDLCQVHVIGMEYFLASTSDVMPTSYHRERGIQDPIIQIDVTGEMVALHMENDSPRERLIVTNFKKEPMKTTKILWAWARDYQGKRVNAPYRSSN